MLYKNVLFFCVFFKNVGQSLYFGSGIVSNFDKYSEIKKTSSMLKHVKKKVAKDDTGSKSPLYPIEVLDGISVS